jgi:nucleoside phosphorylase
MSTNSSLGVRAARRGTRFTGVSGAGGILSTRRRRYRARSLADTSAWRRHQMPAYHLMADDGTGITLVNIGVGPSNAKTICDHLAVLRPEAWLMIGHCGGLRPSQRIGDYVLAHAYLRDDHVLDDVLPPEIPVPAIAEVQQSRWHAPPRRCPASRARSSNAGCAPARSSPPTTATGSCATRHRRCASR